MAPHHMTPRGKISLTYPKALNNMLTDNGVKFFLRQHLIFNIATIEERYFHLSEHLENQTFFGEGI